MSDTIDPVTAVQDSALSFDARIAGNIVELLKKVKGIDGMEAMAFAEAFAYVQQFTIKPAGVPFHPGMPA
jgi:hypothetical protein